VSEQLDLAPCEAQRGDVQLQQLPVQLDSVPEHDMRPGREQKKSGISSNKRIQLHQVSPVHKLILVSKLTV